MTMRARQAGFPAEEFVARRERIFEAIGGQGHALLQGIAAPRGYAALRQTNEFFYCCGLEAAQSYLLMDGQVTYFYRHQRGVRIKCPQRSYP